MWRILQKFSPIENIQSGSTFQNSKKIAGIFMKLSKLKMVDHEIDLSTSDTVEKPEQCPLCGETFMNTKDLLEHVFLKHICFKCQINCEHHVSDQKRIIEEKRQDKKVSKDQCDQDDQNDFEIIDQEFGNDPSLEQSYDYVTEKDQSDQANDQIPQFRIREAKSSFWCSQCDFVAISRPRLVAHETLKHKENDRGKWIVKLEELKIDQIALYLHKETSHGVDQSQENEHNDQSQQIEENEQNVLEQPPPKRVKISPQELEQTKLKSNQCGKWIVKLEELKIDQKTVYICDICQTSFFTDFCALYLHKETSHGFDQSQQMEQNEQNVLEQPPPKRAKISPQELEYEQTKLKLNQCLKSALEYHLDHVHGPRNESKLKNRRHKCDLCDKAYKNSSGLYNHVQSVHYKVTFKCDLCPRKLKSQGALYNHKKNIHWNK